jgi:hypothetical protein
MRVILWNSGLPNPTGVIVGLNLSAAGKNHMGGGVGKDSFKPFMSIGRAKLPKILRGKKKGDASRTNKRNVLQEMGNNSDISKLIQIEGHGARKSSIRGMFCPLGEEHRRVGSVIVLEGQEEGLW